MFRCTHGTNVKFSYGMQTAVSRKATTEGANTVTAVPILARDIGSTPT